MTAELPSPEELDALEVRLRHPRWKHAVQLLDDKQAADAIAALRAALDEANEARAKMLNTMVNALHDAPTSEEAEKAANAMMTWDKTAALIRQQAREIARLQDSIMDASRISADVEREMDARAERAEAERDALRVDAERLKQELEQCRQGR